MNLENTVKKASQKLKDNNIISYLLDAEIILADILGVERESLITNNKANVSQKIVSKYNEAIQRRIKNEPIAYILGKKEFWSEYFIVDKCF